MGRVLCGAFFCVGRFLCGTFVVWDVFGYVLCLCGTFYVLVFLLCWTFCRVWHFFVCVVRFCVVWYLFVCCTGLFCVGRDLFVWYVFFCVGLLCLGGAWFVVGAVKRLRNTFILVCRADVEVGAKFAILDF